MKNTYFFKQNALVYKFKVVYSVWYIYIEYLRAKLMDDDCSAHVCMHNEAIVVNLVSSNIMQQKRVYACI